MATTTLASLSTKRRTMANQPALINLRISNDPPPAKKIGAGLAAAPAAVGGVPVITGFDGANQTLRLDMRVFSPFDGLLWDGNVQLDEGFFFEGQDRTFRELVFDGPNSDGSGGFGSGVRITAQFGQFGRNTSFVNHSFLIWAFTVVETNDTLLLKFIPDTQGETYTWVPEGEQLAEYTAWLDRATAGKGHFTLVQVDAKFYNLPPTPMRETVWSAGAAFDAKLRNIPPKLTQGGLASDKGAALNAGLREILPKIVDAELVSAGSSVNAPLSPIPNKQSQAGLSAGGAAADVHVIDRLFPGSLEVAADIVANNSALAVGTITIKPGVKTTLSVSASSGAAFDGRLKEIDPETARGSIVSGGATFSGALRKLPVKPSLSVSASSGAGLGATPVIIPVKKAGAGFASVGAVLSGAPTKTMIGDKETRAGAVSGGAGLGAGLVKVPTGVADVRADLRTTGARLDGKLRGIKPAVKETQAGVSTLSAALDAELQKIANKDAAVSQVSGGAALAGALHKVPPLPIFDFEITNINSRADRFSNIGYADDSDDVLIPKEYLADSDNVAFVDRLRVRSNALRIDFDGDAGRFSAEVESDYLIVIESPIGDRIAVLNGIGAFWQASNNRYFIASDAPFLMGDLASVNSAIRTNGVGEFVRVSLVLGPVARVGAGLSQSGSTLAATPERDLPGTKTVRSGFASQGVSSTGRLRKLPTEKTASGLSSRGAGLGAELRKLPAKQVGSGISTGGAALDGQVDKTRIKDEIAGAGLSTTGAVLGGAPISVKPGGAEVGSGIVSVGAGLGAGLRKLPTKKSLVVFASGGAGADGALSEIPTKKAGVGISASGAVLSGDLSALETKKTQAGLSAVGAGADGAPSVDKAGTKQVGADLRAGGAAADGAAVRIRSLFRPAGVGLASVGSALGGLLRKLPIKRTSAGLVAPGQGLSAGLTQIPTKKAGVGLVSGGGATADAQPDKIPVPPEWEFIVTNVAGRPNSFSTIGSTGTDDDQPVPRGFLTPDSPQGAVLNFLRIRANQFQVRFRLEDTRFAEFVENDYFLEIADEDDNTIALLWMYGSTWGTDRYRINNDRFFFAGSLDAINTFVRDNGVGTVVRMRIYEPPTVYVKSGLVANQGALNGGVVAVPFKQMLAGSASAPAALGATPIKPDLPAVGAELHSTGASLNASATKDAVVDEVARSGLSAGVSFVDGALVGIKPVTKFARSGLLAGASAVSGALRKLLAKTTQVGLASGAEALSGALSKLKPKSTQADVASSSAALDGGLTKTTVGDKDVESGLASSGAAGDAKPVKIRTEDQSSSGFVASGGATLSGGLSKLPTKKTRTLAASTGAALSPALNVVGVETDSLMETTMISTGAAATGELRKLPPVKAYVAMVTAGMAVDGAVRKLLAKVASASMFAGNAALQDFAERNTPIVKPIGCGMAAGSRIILQPIPSEVNVPMALPYTIQLDTPITRTTGPDGFAQWRANVPAERTTADGERIIQFQCWAQGLNRVAGIGITFIVEREDVNLNDELEGALLQIRSPDGTEVYSELILDEDSNVSPGQYTWGMPYAEAQDVLNGGDTGLQLHFTPPDTRIFNFLITDVGATPAAWTTIGDTSDDDDQRVERSLSLNGAQATIGHMRCRSTQFQIFFEDGRLSPEVEANWALDIESPNGTRLALISGDLGRYWAAANTRYNFTADDVFLDTTRSAFNTAIRARGEGSNVRMTLKEPVYVDGEAYHLAGGEALGAGLRKLLHKMASAGLSSGVGAAADARAGKVPPAIKPAGSGMASGGPVLSVLGMRFQIPFFVGAQAVARGAALAAGVRKIPVGPNKRVGAGAVEGGAGLGAGLRKLLGKAVEGTMFGGGAGLSGGIETFKDDAAAGLAGGGGGVLDTRPTKIQPILEGPTDLRVINRGRNFVAIAWTSPDDFGLEIQEYEYSVDGGAWTKTGSPETQAIVSGLVIDTSYTVAVRGVNTAGPGAASDAINIRTVMPVQPSAPQNLEISATGGRSLDLRWELPEDDGGVPIERYQVCVIDETGIATPFEDTDDSSLTWRIRGLAFGHRYGFRMRAVSSAGVGSPGPIVYGVPETNRPPIRATGVVIPILDSDRQSLVLRIDDQDCLLTLWWQPSDSSWWASLEVPINTPAVSARRMALNAGLLDRVKDILPGNIVMRAAGGASAEPGRDAFARNTHVLRWEV